MLRPGDQVTVSPAELVPGGASLSRIDGFPVFVIGLYPGDEAVVRLTEVKKGFGRGEVLSLLREGPLRRVLPCPVTETCGGCDWTALRLDYQIDAKRGILLDALRRVGKIDPALLPPITVHTSPLNYRLRSRLQVQAGKVGFFALRSHEVVPLPRECEVVGPLVIRDLDRIRAVAEEIGNGEILTLESAGELEITSGSAKHLTIEVNGFKYTVSTAAFFQVNRHLLSTLLDLVLRSAEGSPRWKRALDLFSGVGFFTIPISRIFGEVIGVEEWGESHRLAEQNAGPDSRIRFVAARVEDFLRDFRDEVDFIFMDPPRAGVSPEALESISASGATNMAYLSCDPVTFSRDASRLLRRGWILKSLDLIDLFPNTHHVETFGVFRSTRD
jgi:23S rRNA (uracil1939-C5)-methyltransferase